MKRIFAILVLLSFLPLFADREGIVIPSALNLRVRPDSASPVVLVLKRGAKLTIVSEKTPDWYGIALPSSAEVWIASNFLRRDGSPTKNARFRGGPGALYDSFDPVPESSAPLRVLERVSNGHWLRIAPLPGMTGYVMRQFIRKTPSGDEKASAKKSSDDPSLLDFIEGDERSVSLEGTLKLLKTPFRDAAHELTITLGEKEYPVCYLISPQLNIRLWEGRLVRVDGIQRWCRESAHPVVEIEKISPSWK